jgi:hypothetical protein
MPDTLLDRSSAGTLILANVLEVELAPQKQILSQSKGRIRFVFRSVVQNTVTVLQEFIGSWVSGGRHCLSSMTCRVGSAF